MSKVCAQSEGHEASGQAGSAGAAGTSAHARVVYKPLVRKGQALDKESGEGKRSASAPQDPFRRAANEDDDGYDPYSDRPADPVPLFESDPWS